MRRMLPLAFLVTLAGFLLVQGYKSSTSVAPGQNAPASASRLQSDLVPIGPAGDTPAVPDPTEQAENTAFTDWLQQFSQTQEPRRATEILNTQEKQRLVDYLVASARIAWPQDPVALREALLENKDGRPAKLDAVIRGFASGVAELKKLTPPERLIAVHEATLSQLTDLIGVYQDLRDDAGTSIAATWKGPTMAGLRERSAQTLQQIRELVTQYQLQLPEDVLPPYAL
ncbi:hypothetical protein HYW68_00790 [Candidatus Parcubacteria bacterium]|nr:hypothetical protein [Candidatus Parcubacteria bacterium]